MTPKPPRVDPEDVLLWRMPRRRLEAEAIRDGIMTVSGGLTYAEGGSILSYKDREYVANTAKGGKNRLRSADPCLFIFQWFEVQCTMSFKPSISLIPLHQTAIAILRSLLLKRCS